MICLEQCSQNDNKHYLFHLKVVKERRISKNIQQAEIYKYSYKCEDYSDFQRLQV